MRLVFVHGWSVTNTNTYGGLPQALAAAAAGAGMALDIRHLFLGRYISFHDEVAIDDIARALDAALRELPGGGDGIAPFSCITHSTGGPVLREWLDRFHGQGPVPLVHLVMLAPANHGSALARLGKARVGRIQAWFNGVEPGQRVLDWLALGSDGQWRLNAAGLAPRRPGFYPFVLTGEGIDRRFYDFLNSYLIEPGSDGVVRVAGANMDCGFLTLVQDPGRVVGGSRSAPVYALRSEGGIRRPTPVPLGVYAGYSHSGPRMGIMGSVRPDEAAAPVVRDVLACLRVSDEAGYRRMGEVLAAQTAKAQQGGDRFCMLVFQVRDDTGAAIGENAYDLLLLGGRDYQPRHLPDGFFRDRQMNAASGRLVYYMDADRLAAIKDGCFGIRVSARPSAGFAHYRPGEYRAEGEALQRLLVPNTTTYIEIVLHRHVDENTFRLDPATEGTRDFRRIRPSGHSL